MYVCVCCVVCMHVSVVLYCVCACVCGLVLCVRERKRECVHVYIIELWWIDRDDITMCTHHIRLLRTLYNTIYMHTYICIHIDTHTQKKKKRIPTGVSCMSQVDTPHHLHLCQDVAPGCTAGIEATAFGSCQEDTGYGPGHVS